MTKRPDVHSGVERRIAVKLIDDILAAGHCITVNDGEQNVLWSSRDRTAILKAMASTDMDWICVNDALINWIGSVLLVWGNGTDLISDYSWPINRGSANIEALQSGAAALAEDLAG